MKCNVMIGEAEYCILRGVLRSECCDRLWVVICRMKEKSDGWGVVWKRSGVVRCVVAGVDGGRVGECWWLGGAGKTSRPVWNVLVLISGTLSLRTPFLCVGIITLKVLPLTSQCTIMIKVDRAAELKCSLTVLLYISCLLIHSAVIAGEEREGSEIRVYGREKNGMWWLQFARSIW